MFHSDKLQPPQLLLTVLVWTEEVVEAAVAAAEHEYFAASESHHSPQSRSRPDRQQCLPLIQVASWTKACTRTFHWAWLHIEAGSATSNEVAEEYIVEDAASFDFAADDADNAASNEHWEVHWEYRCCFWFDLLYWRSPQLQLQTWSRLKHC